MFKLNGSSCMLSSLIQFASILLSQKLYFSITDIQWVMRNTNQTTKLPMLTFMISSSHSIAYRCSTWINKSYSKHCLVTMTCNISVCKNWMFVWFWVVWRVQTFFGSIKVEQQSTIYWPIHLVAIITNKILRCAKIYLLLSSDCIASIVIKP